MCPIIRLKSITELLNKKAAQDKEFLMEMNNIENKDYGKKLFLFSSESLLHE
jgi:hypothetical protein